MSESLDQTMVEADSNAFASPPFASTPTPRGQGIDIHEAMSILSARSGPGASGQGAQEGDVCGCCHSNEVPKSAKAMGQTIDMMAQPSEAPSIGSDPAAMSEEQRQQEEGRIKEEREQRLQKIRQALQSMSDTELLKAVLKAQQDRVATYRDYESGILTVLQTGNMTSYPDTCSKVTASFSVLSETIKSIKEVLKARKREEPARFIEQLQTNEKEKLHLTAAHHLERIRHRNQRIQPTEDLRIEKLLETGVCSLQQRISSCVENINEVLDEIRCTILEED